MIERRDASGWRDVVEVSERRVWVVTAGCLGAATRRTLTFAGTEVWHWRRQAEAERNGHSSCWLKIESNDR
jgi:hypothetical protein